MTLTTLNRVLVPGALALSLVACATGAPTADEVAVAPLVVDETASPTVDPAGGDAVVADVALAADLERLAVWLNARHAEDLPDAEQLATLHDAEAALLAYEADADHMMDRTRALSLLRFAPGPDARARLEAVAGDAASHPAARAAAVDGLAGATPDDALRDLVGPLVTHDDARVSAAAERTLDAWTAGAPNEAQAP